MGRFMAVIFAVAVCTSGTNGAIFPDSGPTTPGARAVLHGGIALAPAQAPLAVKRAIWAANQLRSKPYRYGGGHALFRDRGYDCSGTVSYALGGAGLVSSPMSSSDFRRYGQRGQGRWNRLHAQRTYVCGDRRFKIGYHAWRQFPVSLGAALANDFSGSGWI